MISIDVIYFQWCSASGVRRYLRRTVMGQTNRQTDGHR